MTTLILTSILTAAYVTLRINESIQDRKWLDGIRNKHHQNLHTSK